MKGKKEGIMSWYFLRYNNFDSFVSRCNKFFMVVQDMLLKKKSTMILDLIEYSNMLFVGSSSERKSY